MTARAIIFGCSGLSLTAAERELFARSQPLGFILFARNIAGPAQLRSLIAELRDSVGRPDAPVLIDQEGGRVARLREPHWRAGPAVAKLGAVAANDPAAARELCWLHGRLIADQVSRLGIDVVCAPVLDVPVPGAHDVIGDRAFGRSAVLVVELGRAMAEGLLAGGVAPVIKHIPGHGKTRTDSHTELPVVDAPLAVLEAEDFAPFRALNDMPWGMTAHVLYTAVDAARPATTSPIVVERVIRGLIGFDGVLLSDDIGMEALAGTPRERAVAILAAGCDVVLHCSGDLDEMLTLADTVPNLTAAAQARIARGAALVTRHRRDGFDREQAIARIDNGIRMA